MMMMVMMILVFAVCCVDAFDLVTRLVLIFICLRIRLLML